MVFAGAFSLKKHSCLSCETKELTGILSGLTNDIKHYHMNKQEELKGLKIISELSFYSSLIITPLSVIFSKITGSSTLVVYNIWTAAAIGVKIFSLISIRIMMKENRFMFPLHRTHSCSWHSCWDSSYRRPVLIISVFVLTRFCRSYCHCICSGLACHSSSITFVR